MNLQSLAISTFLSIGIFAVVSTIGGKIALEYTYAAFANMNIGAASTAPKIVKTSLFIGVLLSCYVAIGFANRNKRSAIQKGVYIFAVSLPVVVWATYPELKSFYLDAKHVQSLIYNSVAAFVGVFLGLRFNSLKKI